MIENQFCRRIKLDFPVNNNFLNTLIDKNSISDVGYRHLQIDLLTLDESLTNFLNLLDIKIDFAEVFYTFPGQSLPIHLDNGCQCKLNFVYGAENSLMQWWKIIKTPEFKNFQHTEIGGEVISFDSKDCELIWSDTIGCPSLVRVDEPHSILNCTEELRASLSLVLINMKTKKLLSWEEGIEIFSPYIIN
jgi:hypothetical protein